MTDLAAAVPGLAAGGGGAVLAVLGVAAPSLPAALIGRVFGVSFAPAVGRLHAVLLFAASVCASAVAASVAGPVVAAWLPAVSPAVASKGAALAIGVLLHPLIQVASKAAPDLIRGMVDRFGGRA